MSYWTYINGTIVVEPMGRTQPEKKYILDTVLDHLPIVSGSENNMDIHVIQKNGHNSSCSCDEFGMSTNNLVDFYGNKDRKGGWLRTQTEYIIVVYGSLRDRIYSETYKEFQTWLCRLAKRVTIRDVLVRVNDYERSCIITNDHDVYTKMFEDPSWCKDNEYGEPTWCEYLMWDKMKNGCYPIMLAYKYYNCKENDLEAERRIDYYRND